MNDKKKSGSFYTPTIIADFLVDYLSEKLQESSNVSILEPSAGDGVFIKSIYNHSNLSAKTNQVVAVEQNLEELNKIKAEINNPSFCAIHSDFLDYQVNNNETFSLVIGNPPYIKSSLLEDSQLIKSQEIHEDSSLAKVKTKNIWTSFLVRCIKFTKMDGLLAFVLPAELLQVKFASELRDLISREFERVEIFTFNELLFDDCKGQDTLLLIGERKSSNKGIYYCNISKVDLLQKREFTLAQNVKIKDSKWTHFYLDSDEIELLERLKSKLNVVNHYCSSKAGIVTAANDYFIVDSTIVEKYSLQNYIKPIIKKGLFVNGSVDLCEAEFQVLINRALPTYLIAIDKNSVIRRNSPLWNYIRIGEKNEINTRYKTSIRDKWYEVPNIGNPPEAFFFKRCNEYPKLIRNSANVLATDSAYTVSMRTNYQIENLIYSFYNSLTLSFAELYGRYYGGGVLELTPNEFKKLPVPYVNNDNLDFSNYVSDFKSKISIKDVCKANDAAILNSIDPTINDEVISKIFNIREKLHLHRIKKSI